MLARVSLVLKLLCTQLVLGLAFALSVTADVVFSLNTSALRVYSVAALFDKDLVDFMFKVLWIRANLGGCHNSSLLISEANDVNPIKVESHT